MYIFHAGFKVLGKLKTHEPSAEYRRIKRIDIILDTHSTAYTWQAF